MPSSFLSSLIHAGRNPVGVGANYLPFPKVGEYANLGLAFTTPLGLMLPLCAFPHGNGPFIGGTTTKWLHSLAQGWRSPPWDAPFMRLSAWQRPFYRRDNHKVVA